MERTGERFIPDSFDFSELEHLNRYYFVVNQIDLGNKVVLDIASGEGYGSNILSNNAQEVIGVDVSAEAISHAKNKYTSENLKFIQGDATNIPLPNNSIDVIVSFETIEHHDKHHEMLNEIKRVLKIDGTLIISSPDKYYYSDIPQYKNHYHIKELYYEEFKKLINQYFSVTYFFNQKTFAGSIIALNEEYSHYKQPLVVERGGNAHCFLPVYNIAIASNTSDLKIKNQLVLYTESDQVITKADISDAVYSEILKIKSTRTWRIGNFLLRPFKKINNRFKIFNNG